MNGRFVIRKTNNFFRVYLHTVLLFMKVRKYNEVYLFRGAIIAMSIALIALFAIQYQWIDAIKNFQKSTTTENIFIAFNEISGEIITDYFSEKRGTETLVFPYKVSRYEILEYKELIENTLRHYLEKSDIADEFYWELVEKGGTEALMGTRELYQGDNIDNLIAYQTSSIYTQQIPYDLAVYFSDSSWYQKDIIYSTLFISIFCFTILGIGTILNYRLHLKRRKEVDSWIDFIGNMIHEFKTPMSSISLASELIIRPDIIVKPDRILTYGSLIYKENLYLKEKTEQILRSVSLDMQEVLLQLSEVNIHQEIESLTESFALKISERGGELIVKYNASDFVISGDKMHITNVISNLLDNAEKYTEENPKIIIETRSSLEGIHIFVTDNGIGIKQENLNKLFKKFYRVRSDRARRESGYGLGLFYVDCVMRAHKGYVKASSKINKGSIFELFFSFNSLGKK